MRTKGAVELANLPDKEFFEQVAEGMDHCVRNAVSLFADAKRLGRTGRMRGAGILVAFAHEEIAKYLILLDAVRCPPEEQKQRSNQLRRFSAHLAKGLYIRLYEGSPDTLAEIRRFADLKRAEYFLDGPNDTDWIFRNEITSGRERSIYVDYVVSDEGAMWLRPMTKSPVIDGGDVRLRRKAHSLVLSLHSFGFTNAHALAVVAREWRTQVPSDELRWTALREFNIRTLKQLDGAGLARRTTKGVVSPIVNDWLFPLYGVDLSEQKVSLDELRKRQAEWSPS